MSKQKISIEVEDITTFVTALNNSIIAYNEVVMAIDLCCEIPLVFYPLKKVPIEKLRERQRCLRDVYEQLIKIEEKGRCIC